jgi:hypothetical protein
VAKASTWYKYREDIRRDERKQHQKEGINILIH